MQYTVDRLPVIEGEMLMIYADKEYIGKVTTDKDGFCAEHFCYEYKVFKSRHKAVAFVKRQEQRYRQWRQCAGVAA